MTDSLGPVSAALEGDVREWLSRHNLVIWLDADKDGVEDLGESGIANVEVVLKDQFGTPVATAFTNSNGDYSFTGIPDGDYLVEVVIPLDDLGRPKYEVLREETVNVFGGDQAALIELPDGVYNTTMAFTGLDLEDDLVLRA